MTNKQASGIGHTLSASACFRIQTHQNMQSLLGFDFVINKCKHHKCKHLSAHYRFIKLALDVAPCVGATVSEDDSAHGIMKSGPIIEVWH
jgi:hypothetical protein